MSELNQVAKELNDILANVAKTQNISHYDVVVNANLTVTEGFLSDFYTGIIKNTESGEKTSVAIKKIPKNEGLFTDYKVLFKNEEQFYSKIFPTLEKFQNEKQVSKRFDNVPNYFCGSAEASEKDHIAMQDIKDLGYNILDKKNCFDENHLNLVFETFGRFHALSFAFKSQYVNEYNYVVKDLVDVLKGLTDKDAILEAIEHNISSAIEALDHLNDAELIRKLKNLGNVKRFVLDAIKYNGPYRCIIHGDSWSNNMLFKYKEFGELDDMKLIDFQLSRESSPVHDLIFFFYCSASKNDLDKLDTYLEKYHQSFSTFAHELGCDPDILFPWSFLKVEWKEFAVAGAFFSIDMWVLKLMDYKTILELRSKQGSKEETSKIWDEEMEKVRKTDLFKDTARNIFVHLVENCFL